MKRIMKMAALALIIVLGSSIRNGALAQYDNYDDSYDDSYNNSRDVDYQTFYDELSPHGNWIEYPGYGYVWQPSMGGDFRPYSSGGHWVYSEQYEWIWVSDYDWGWAPFHYGRWFSDPRYGWLWVPGYEWSGAWVTWRDGGDYYGWAPIRPGISISINFNIGGYAPPIDYWIFAPRRYILYSNIYNHCVDYRRNVTIINQTTIINNYNYGDRYGWRSGPRRYDVERYAGNITPVRFRESNRPGRSSFRNNEVSIYRPNVRQDNSNTRIAPRKFDRFDRNATSDNGTVRTNDTRNGNSNNGGFRRNDNTVRTNEQPVRTPSNDRRFDRRNENVRQPQTNNGTSTNPNDRRRFDRTTTPNNGNSQPTREPRVMRTDRTPSQGNSGQDNRQFERRGNGNSPNRQPAVRTQENNTVRTQRQAPQQMERRQAPQQVERRQAPQQVERRQAPATQPRQMERRENTSSRQQAPATDKGSNGKGNGNGKRRF